MKKRNNISPILRLTNCLHTSLFLAQPARAPLLGRTLCQPKHIFFVEQTKRKFWERQHDYSTPRPAGEKGRDSLVPSGPGRGKREGGHVIAHHRGGSGGWGGDRKRAAQDSWIKPLNCERWFTVYLSILQTSILPSIHHLYGNEPFYFQ
jgi:hypothetical protein